MILEITVGSLDYDHGSLKDMIPGNNMYNLNKRETKVSEKVLSEMYASTQYFSDFINKSQ